VTTSLTLHGMESLSEIAVEREECRISSPPRSADPVTLHIGNADMKIND